MAGIDRAGRAIAGLLTYNPGPGIYSRLERAIEAMPASVRAQELPGLLKRYKEGVPGWELKATDLDSVIAGRDVVPRDELLAAVKERSPVYTHGEVILGGRPQIQHVPTGGTASYYDAATDTLTPLPADTRPVPDYQYPDTGEVSRLGTGVSHGEPKYRDYGQGGADYAELLLTQPGHKLSEYGSHWGGDTKNAVAHARFDTHGDALRINELQSDLGIHNRKAREYADQNPQIHFGERLNPPEKQGLPFPLEDAWTELLIKRLALEAARKGHRAVEVASPRAIADKVGGNIDNYEHFYGKVVPGAIERLGRKMGGLVEDTASSGRYVRPEEPLMGYSEIADRLDDFQGPSVEALKLLRSLDPPGPRPAFAHAPQSAFNRLVRAIGLGPNAVGTEGTMLQGVLEANLRRAGVPGGEATLTAIQHMPRLVRLAEEQAAMYASHSRLRDLGEAQERARALAARRAPQPPGRRYIMSDEMRRRLIEQGVGASLLAPLLMSNEDQ